MRFDSWKVVPFLIFLMLTPLVFGRIIDERTMIEGNKITIAGHDRFYLNNTRWQNVDERLTERGGLIYSTDYYYRLKVDHGAVWVGSFSYKLNPILGTSPNWDNYRIKNNMVEYSLNSNIGYSIQFMPRETKNKIVVYGLSFSPRDFNITFNYSGDTENLNLNGFIKDCNKTTIPLYGELSRSMITYRINASVWNELCYPIIFDPDVTIKKAPYEDGYILNTTQGFFPYPRFGFESGALSNISAGWTKSGFILNHYVAGFFVNQTGLKGLGITNIKDMNWSFTAWTGSPRDMTIYNVTQNYTYYTNNNANNCVNDWNCKFLKDLRGDFDNGATYGTFTPNAGTSPTRFNLSFNSGAKNDLLWSINNATKGWFGWGVTKKELSTPPPITASPIEIASKDYPIARERWNLTLLVETPEDDRCSIVCDPNFILNSSLGCEYNESFVYHLCDIIVIEDGVFKLNATWELNTTDDKMIFNESGSRMIMKNNAELIFS